MKIAFLSLIYKLTTPGSKGGAEVWAYNFISEHARRGHQIDLYAVEGSFSGPNITLIPSLEKPVVDYYDNDYFKKDDPVEFGKQKREFRAMVYTRALNEVRKRQAEYDVILDSTASATLAFNADMVEKPMLTIGHNPPDKEFSLYASVFGWPDNATLVFPSTFQNDRARFIPASNRAVIPHGIDLALFHFDPDGGEEMVWMSRIDYPHMDKGVRDAMLAANFLGKKLHVTGFVESGSRAYVENTLRSLVTPNISFEEQESSTPVDKNKFFGDAKLFLFPTQWEEPFGIVMLEALACGTPVVAYARGAIPEVVVDGVTGFIVNPSDDDRRGDFVIKKTGRDGLCEAVERIYALLPNEYSQMRQSCRAHVEGHFMVSQMVDKYERLYAKLLQNLSPKTSRI